MRRTFAVTPSTTVEKQIRVRFYAKVQHMPVAFHDGWGSGQLLSRMLTDINVIDRKSTRLNSSHVAISYAVFCLKKKIWYEARVDYTIYSLVVATHPLDAR